MSRAAVLSRFGPPDRERELWKTSKAIWGPIEDFWSRVPEGAQVTIWQYRSVQGGGSVEPIDGSTELYFVNDSDSVDGIGFAVEGAVYEAGP